MCILFMLQCTGINVEADCSYHYYFVACVLFREGAEDVSTWIWLGANESVDIPTPHERS